MRATIMLGLMALCGATGATLQEIGRLPEYCGAWEFRTPDFGWCGAPPGVHKIWTAAGLGSMSRCHSRQPPTPESDS